MPTALKNLARMTTATTGTGTITLGSAVTITSSAQSGGTYKLVGNSVTFTAAGGTIATFRYAVLYNATAAGGNLIGWWDYGTNLTVTSGNSFQVQTDQTNGVLQLA